MTAIEEIPLTSPDETVQPVNSLNIGCGRDIRQGWVNLDRFDGPGVDVVADLETEPLPFPGDHFDELYMSHVIEHISNVLPMMEELYRVAKPGAELVIRCPHGSSDDADEDPTHVRRMFHGSFLAFAQPYFWRADYGYRGDWSTQRVQLMVSEKLHKGKSHQVMFERIQSRRNQVIEMVASLRAVKPRRAQDYSLFEQCEVGIQPVKVG